jgi:hypothetical protein
MIVEQKIIVVLVTIETNSALGIETQRDNFDPLWATIATKTSGKQRTFRLHSSFDTIRGKSLTNHSYLSNAAIILQRIAAAESSAFLILISNTRESLLELRLRIMLARLTT